VIEKSPALFFALPKKLPFSPSGGFRIPDTWVTRDLRVRVRRKCAPAQTQEPAIGRPSARRLLLAKAKGQR
jgi:hypothetical protein